MAITVSRTGRQRRVVNEINVVPYIDVMLVLLVIFMVTAPLLSPGVIDLPTVGSSRIKQDLYLEVQIPAIGGMVLQLNNADQPAGEVGITTDTLAQAVRSLTDGNPDIPVVISADKAVLYENVMGVMNQLKEMGVRKVGLLVKKPN